MNLDRRLRTFFSVFVFAYAFFFAARPLTDADFWWHLKTGEYIVKTHSVPTTDFFSFTNYGKPWVAHEWLSEVIFYLIYSRFGFNVLIVVFAILTALAFWILYRRSESHPLIGAVAALLGVWTVLPTIGVRPRVFTLLLSSVYLALLARYIKREKGREIWWLVPLMVLWVNLHGGFLIGLVLIGLALVGAPLDSWARGEKLTSAWPKVRGLSVVLVGCLLAVLLNPHGFQIYKFPFEIFLSPVQQQAIVDWQSPDFHQPEALPLMILVFLTIWALSLSAKRVRPSELLFFIATLYMTLKSGRHVAILALVAVPLLADYLQIWITERSGDRLFSMTAVDSERANRMALMLSVMFLVPLIAFAAKLKATVFDEWRQEVLKVPLSAVAYLKDNQITGNTFTDPNIWGGYVIWALPSNPVYIDGRIDMYGDQFVKDYLNIIWNGADWREPFNRYGVRVVIIEPKSALSRELLASGQWSRVFEDNVAVVFVRN
ncbi:MAG TPA: hypothetical protein VHS05_24090 [Pyrinomonadaceae bacterium]|nr:hypothetical protein [Pyrinomonadaceae bacterium]